MKQFWNYLEPEEVGSDERWDRLPANSMGHRGDDLLAPWLDATPLARDWAVSSENPRRPGFVGKPIFHISEPMLQLLSAENTFGSYQEWVWSMLCFHFHSQTKSDESIRMDVLEVKSLIKNVARERRAATWIWGSVHVPKTQNCVWI